MFGLANYQRFSATFTTFRLPSFVPAILHNPHTYIVASVAIATVHHFVIETSLKRDNRAELNTRTI